MTGKKFHLFSWSEYGPYPSSSNAGVSEMYDRSFVSIEAAQEWFASTYFNAQGNPRRGAPDSAEIIEIRDDEMFVVATGFKWGKFGWSTEIEQITNLPSEPEPSPEPKPEPVKMPDLVPPVLLVKELVHA